MPVLQDRNHAYRGRIAQDTLTNKRALSKQHENKPMINSRLTHCRKWVRLRIAISEQKHPKLNVISSFAAIKSTFLQYKT
jgi:hypothetical protein